MQQRFMCFSIKELLTTNRPVMTLVSSGIVRTACGLPDARRSACFLGACSPQRSPHKFYLTGVCRSRSLPAVSTENRHIPGKHAAAVVYQV